MSETRAAYYLDLEQVTTIVEDSNTTIADLQHRITELEANNDALVEAVKHWQGRFGGLRQRRRALRRERDLANAVCDFMSAELHRLTEKCVEKDEEIQYMRKWCLHLESELLAADWWRAAWKSKAKKYRNAYFVNFQVLSDYRNLLGSVRQRLAYLYGEAPRQVQERIGEMLEEMKLEIYRREYGVLFARTG